MTTEQPLKAVIYCRVSDTSQNSEDAHGLQSQEIRIREYASRKGYEVVATFHDDVSGKFARRPALTAMVDLLMQQKKSYIVLVDDTTRLARSPRAHLAVRDSIAAVAYRLESPTKVYRDDPEDDVEEMIEAVFSGYHRRQNAIQTKNRMRSRVMAGYWCFPPPIGYTFAKVAGHGKLMVRNEPVASVVQEALEGYACGRFQTQAEVMRFLASRPEYPENLRKVLTRERINEILTRPTYAGYLSVADWGLHLVPAKHEPLISFETFQRIKDRMAGRANVPARKDLNLDFPLRGAIHCTCGRPLMGCWSTSRNGQRHPYYLCQNKGACEHYGKSIRRDVIEGEFAALLAQMRPSKPVFAIMYEMLRDIWNAHTADAKAMAARLQLDLKRVEREVGQFLDRVVNANTPSLISAYEDRIRALEEEKVLLRERVASCGRPVADFDTKFRTAMEYLGNPQKLWVSDRFEDKRAVLKLTFADRLTYARGQGFRTAVTSSPFKLLSDMKDGDLEMVPRRGLEPPRPCDRQHLKLVRLPIPPSGHGVGGGA